MILKKGWFSDLKILEIQGKINSEEYHQDSQTQIKAPQKQEPLTELKGKIIITETPQTPVPQNKY